MSAKKPRKYTEEYKRDTLALIAQEGYTMSEASERLGINESVLRRWKKRFSSDEQPISERPVPVGTEELQEENHRLREENRRLTLEREILKKAAACVL